jgi:hypothetical protein
MKPAAIALLVSLAHLGCAGAMSSWREANCNYDGAYKAGMNAARGGEEMEQNFAGPCEPDTRPDAERGYREGYTEGVASTAPPQTAGGRKWRCEEAYGQKECGYECVQAHGEIACAKKPEHNCVEAHGEVRCGLHCRSDFGKIVCDE